MPTCSSCNRKWTWKQTMKKSFSLDIGLDCPHCGAKQFITAKTRKRSAGLNFIPPLCLLLPILFDVPTTAALSLLVTAGILNFSLYPFYLELTSKEEALW
ncbi:TIGR04104 family putative zinc finger protein [Bacillus sp. FJAT-27251]|uniref:TIGR04104 family putative zinc finger protein n=1 Tax=Bacillus sp. FJAT-27251 TaxID=1684142 RepID=UPI0006A79B62|nr:TIGR04104 family putative zinc finger protein [Bacillus sp. FJAT-27251]